jgi:hypothetical protein
VLLILLILFSFYALFALRLLLFVVLGAVFCLSVLCYFVLCTFFGPPLWSSGQSSWLQTQRSRVRFPTLPDFLSSCEEVGISSQRASVASYS